MSERVWNPKPPTETVAFVDDWTDELGSDTIASYTFARTSGDATISKDDRVGAADLLDRGRHRRHHQHLPDHRDHRQWPGADAHVLAARGNRRRQLPAHVHDQAQAGRA
jgi:hypothetical protein